MITEKIKQDYEVGLPIFLKLFNLKKDDFIKVLKNIFQDDTRIIEILENKPSVIKTLTDDEPKDIKIHFYSSLEINYFGIYYKPEHGQMTMVLKFDKFFNIDAAL